MAGGFTTQVPALCLHALLHIPVPHLGSHEPQALLAQGQFQAQVGHEGPHHAGVAGAPGQAVHGDHVEQLVAVHQFAIAVDKQHPVAIAIKGDAQVHALPAHDVCQRRGIR